MATLGNTTITNLNSGTIRIQPILGSYQEGIRIQPYSNWSTIMLLGTDSTANSSGTSAKSWGIFNNDGNFYINKNASDGQQAPRLWGHANGFTIGNSNTSTYALNTASFICDSWIRTKGNTGWYNESWGGGWYMTDASYIRNYNSKEVLLDNLLTTSSGGSHKGVKVGSTYINGISGDLIFQNNNAIRFGTDSWDYDEWAGLKYVHSSKTISLGLADGSAFTANTAQSGGTLNFPGIGTVSIGGALTVGGNSTFTGSATLSSTLSVASTSTFTGKTTHNGGIGTSAISVTNDATIGGNLIFSSATPYIKFNTSNTVLAYDGTELRLGTSNYKTRIKGSSVAVDSLCSFNAATKSASFSSEVEFKGGGTHTDICPSIAAAFKAKRIMANEAIIGTIYLGASSGTASNTALSIKKYGSVSNTAPATPTDLVTISTAGKITAVGGFEGTASTVAGSYTSNGGQQNPNYFGKNKVGFLMMNTTVNGNSHYKDWLIMDCYSANDVGGGVAFGVNRQALGAYIMRSASERTSWTESAELIGTHNYTSYASTKDHTHTFSGNSNTTSTNGAHTHTTSGTAASDGAHTHTTSGTAASDGAHTHTVSGTVSLSGSLDAGVLTITASFSSGSAASNGAHTHSVSGTAASNGGHDHTVTPTGTISTPK